MASVKLRKSVFFPAFLVLSLFLVFYFINPETTVSLLSSVHKTMLSAMAGPITVLSVFCLLLSVVVFFHPLGRVKIGGPEAKPVLNRWQWFSISFCTTIATGILYWACAEPVIHFNTFQSQEIPATETFGKIIAIMWHHWSGVAYAIFLIPTILMALLIYNKGGLQSVAGFLTPLTGKGLAKKSASWIDALCVFSMIAGISSSLATGLIMLSGSVENITGSQVTTGFQAGLCLFIVLCFVISSISGLMRGIKWLSFLNLILVIAVGLFFLFYSDFRQIYGLTGPAAQSWVTFLSDMTVSGLTQTSTPWMKDWTVFYWSAWIGWAPLSALFLARLTVGYTVRDIIRINLILPTAVTMVWLIIVGATVFRIDLQSGFALSELIKTSGPELILSELLDRLPLGSMTKLLVLMSATISFITTADSNISVMSDLSLRVSATARKNEWLPGLLKLIFGLGIGGISWVMVAWLGIDGLRVLNNMAAIPAFLIVLMMPVSLMVMMVRESRGKPWLPDSIKHQTPEVDVYESPAQVKDSRFQKLSNQ